MTTLKRCVTTAIVFVLAAQLCVAQEYRRSITLAVELNGKMIRSPKEILISYNGQSTRVRLRDGRFEVPSDARHAGEVRISFSLNGRSIHPMGMSARELDAECWKLVIADKRYEGDAAEFQRFIENGVEAKSSCVIVFQKPGIEDWFLFDQNCRK